MKNPKHKPEVKRADEPETEAVKPAAVEKAPEPVHHERYEHPERKAEVPQPADPVTVDNVTAENIQRQANKANHSERTVNGGKRLP